METNETILTRDVIVIESHKRLGGVKGLRVDCDTRAVSHYIVNNVGTGSTLVLPFDKALAVGDTFMTVQSRDDFIASNDAEANKVIDGYELLQAEVFSKTGNRLGKVKGFEFDEVFGKVTRIDLDSQVSFASDTFIFFSTEFVFVDDGAKTAQELRESKTDSDQNAGNSSTVVVSQDVPKDEQIVLEDADPEDSENAEIKEFLVGATLNADVESEDGKFKLPKGSVLTTEMIADAENHDALLLLTINVDV